MANNDPKFASVTGAMETAEPSGPGPSPAQTSNVSSATVNKPAGAPRTQSGTGSAIPAPSLRRQASNSLLPQALSPSGGASPRTSRNTSPIRKDSRPGQPSSGSFPSQPSAAAIQRALSASNVPQLQGTGGAVTEAVSKLPGRGGARSVGPSGSGDTTPQWPVSPRLKSPPPSVGNSRRGSAVNGKKSEPSNLAAVATSGIATPIISVQSATPTIAPVPSGSKQGAADGAGKSDRDTLQAAPKMPSSRGPSGKSTLETVQENTADAIAEPAAAVQAAADLKPFTKIVDDEKSTPKRQDTTEDGGERGILSESEGGGGYKSDSKPSPRASIAQQMSSTNIQQRAKTAPSKNGFMPLTTTKSRQPDGVRNMTVETETVQSIPQSGLNAGDRSGPGRGDASGSIRLKPSNETIRPKKERKRGTQKARSITQGTASSKADIFEARVANAVDEANSSDSEETFVYESNPPEPQRRPTRHHSRTPSVTSAHSTADQRSGIRNFNDVLEERRVAGKRSMKFSNNPFNEHDSPTDRQDGTVRSYQPRHYGRWGRGGSHASMFDQDSPFTQASKLRNSATISRNSKPGSPRSPQSVQHNRFTNAGPLLFGGSGKKDSSFDFDGEGADDERMPLVGSLRTPRSNRNGQRVYGSHSPSIDEYYNVRRRGRCGRLGSCFVSSMVFALVVLSAIAFLVLSNRPMQEIEIRQIRNVLASEQELMLDLLVGAVNPNALGITITDLDLQVFAKARRSANDSLADDPTTTRHRRLRPTRLESTSPSHTPGHHDHGTDPMPPTESDTPPLLLGQVTRFSTPLIFEGSPIKRHEHLSLGELRLLKPGNHSGEAKGSERWTEVLRSASGFELIVRGNVLYNLPISGREQRSEVSGRVGVRPDELDEDGNMRLIQPKKGKGWEGWRWGGVLEEDEGEEWADE
ncbi:hypothetical protein B0A48_16967 [Cryoendolithus antarcticus]|uniref:Vacuolar segregation subunit 7 n=1 Tax=Cryoendolithus antarcticus TaxID=1507870 RepID=A0A1V8SD26_9PEZI|nr:hypothetical protein B0A48_16967 [Cryoendolithus antarcticus]